jgi:cardiolipin synthase C
MSAACHIARSLLAALGLALLLGACATVNWNYPRAASTAFAEPEITSVGALFKPAADRHPGLSGFSLLRFGENAFLARMATIDLAEKTIDAQYYIWDADTTGRILAERLLRAADRGVRVRLLLDDFYQTSGKDSVVALIDAHPNIEVRVFNPVGNRLWRRASFLSDFSRVNHRMHNKLLAVDNAVAIVGGRNIADIYFGAGAEHNYRDLDVIAAGPVVREISASFDLFWNSAWAVPAAAVVNGLPGENDLAAARKALEEKIAAAGAPYPVYRNTDEVRARLAEMRDQFVWAPGRVFVESPSRVGAAVARGVIHEALSERVNQLERELLIESPYFVLPDPVIERVGRLVASGVKVRALTNSAASNDVMAAHAFYAQTRAKLLKAGVELYELRPDSDVEKHWSVLSGRSRAALHCKAIVFDRKAVFIGSFNLDPRSSTLNTEVGVMIDSPELAGRVADIMDEGVAPGSAFRVALDGDERLVWTAETGGETVRYGKDPETNLWHRFLFGFIGILPIKEQS